MRKISMVVLAVVFLSLCLLVGCIQYSVVLPPEWPNRTKSGLQLRWNIKNLGPVEIKNGKSIDTQKTIALSNGTPSSGLTRVGEAKVWTDPKGWGDVIVEQLGVELQKRGVVIGPQPNHTFKVSVTSITLTGSGLMRATVYVKVERADGWAKTYKGYCDPKAPDFEKKVEKYDPPIIVEPLEKATLCWAVIFVTDEIINDPAFRQALK